MDSLLLPAMTVFAVVIRFEGTEWPEGMASIIAIYLAAVLPLKLALLIRTGMYGRLWRYAGAADLEKLAVAGLGFTAVSLAVGAFMLPAVGVIPHRVPLSVVVLDCVLGMLAVAFPRLLVRLLQRRRRVGKRADEGRRALIVGAGAAGGLIAKELSENPQIGLTTVGFVDDDPSKQGRRIGDVSVLGPLSSIETVVREYEIGEIIIAMPAAPGTTVREVLRAANRVGVPTRTVPGLFEIISGSKSVGALRGVAIEDLLRRDPITTDLEQVRRLARGRIVMVTGAGGSIGSELCRQLARLSPARLVVLGRGENSIFELGEELARSFPQLVIEPVIADVRDYAAMSSAFSRTRPHCVFHAAAHKHVPLMEQNVAEAVLNNVRGTSNVVNLSAEHDTERFVLISSDKAVRPTSIMGATKRIAEQLVQEVSCRTSRPYVSVRFGNVLGSRGSVVPTFLRQIAAGGPVTVTHPEMRRYFMTIPEAVQLVLQAGALGTGSETFVLDMGEPVRIADLAADLIRLSGLTVGDDIEIHFTGMRPGEKLYEELFFGAESATPTVHPKILRACSLDNDGASLTLIEELMMQAVANARPAELRRLIADIVPDYAPPADAPLTTRFQPKASAGTFEPALASTASVVGASTIVS